MRNCSACGGSLEGRRAHARHCSPRCRREAYRVAKLAAGIPDAPYATLSQYQDRRRNVRSTRANSREGA